MHSVSACGPDQSGIWAPVMMTGSTPRTAVGACARAMPAATTRQSAIPRTAASERRMIMVSPLSLVTGERAARAGTGGDRTDPVDHPAVRDAHVGRSGERPREVEAPEPDREAEGGPAPGREPPPRSPVRALAADAARARGDARGDRPLRAGMHAPSIADLDRDPRLGAEAVARRHGHERARGAGRTAPRAGA